MTNGWQRTVLAACCGLLANACNLQSPTAGIDRGGIRTPIVTQGPITGFGSIVVNGVHYDITTAAIQVDGGVASGTDLQLGELVTVVGERDTDGTTGVADSVLVQTNVRGPVQAVDAAAGTLTVLAQDIVVDSATVLDFGADPADLSAIAVGDVVSVSGFSGTSGLIEATRIARVSPSKSYRIFGTVSHLHAPAFRFNINGLVVDYRSAFVIDGFPNGGPADGDQVAVEGTVIDPSGVLQADKLEHEQPVEHHSGESEVEGLITRFVSPEDFDVAGVRATTTSDTVYEGGAASDLALNVKVQVEGSADDAGVVVARKVEIKDGGRVVGSGEDR